MYNIGTYITEPIGNNEFSYNERIALGSKGKIFIPSLIQGTIDDLEEGSEIVFEEIENGKIKSCTGLKYFIQTKYQGISTYIFDNHNHALFFRYQHTKQFEDTKSFVVIHIDQHTDTKPNKNNFKAGQASLQRAFRYTNYECNVGNFLTSAKDAGIIEEIIQIRSEHALHNMKPLDFLKYNYILDIDMDFWEKKTNEEIKSDFAIIRELINNVCLITIATSPFFMDQKRAIELIKRFFNINGHL